MALDVEKKTSIFVHTEYDEIGILVYSLYYRWSCTENN